VNGIPECGTGRHEDYLSQQDERADVARERQAEQDCAEWRGWMEASAYSTHPDDCEGMAEAFEAGMRVAEPWTVAELAAALDSFYAWFTVTGGGARVQGQLLGADADDFARALHAGLESGRAHRR
jgi:hypothetical protein